MNHAPLPTLMIVPTGIGCEIGGYAGDALPSARLLASASDCLITHPNVMNGASLYWNDSRILYVEGYGLDRFASGDWSLRPVRQQVIGLLLDAGIEPDLAQRHIQVAEGFRASIGLNIGSVITTDQPLEVNLEEGKSGASWGKIRRPDLLLRAGERLKEAGATAIAIVTRFPENIDSKTFEAYRQGSGVDALAGAEAVISHLLVRHLQIPCAHAPALSPLPLDSQLDARAAGEDLGYTFLACVLMGLSRAPDLITDSQFASDLSVEQLGAVVAPNSALGGEALLSCIERQIPLITVNNSSILSVTSDRLGIDSDIYSASNYAEAAGLLLAIREGLTPNSLARPLKSLERLS